MARRETTGLLITLLVFVIALATAVLFVSSTTDDHDHHYEQGDVVPFFVNKIGRFANPSETYHYYDLPFCRPDELIGKTGSPGEVLNGDRLTNSLYELKFRVDKDLEHVCNKTLNEEEVAKFRAAVMDDFYIQMHYDDLPFRGFVGETLDDTLWGFDGTEQTYLLFTHIKFNILYNENHVIEIRCSGDPETAVDISEDVAVDVEFTYSVVWNATLIQFADRMENMRAFSAPEQLKKYRFSMFYSIFLAVVLVGTQSLMCTQIRRLSREEEEDEEMNREEVRWKLLHGDVFRYPPHTSLLCAVIGSGTLLLTLVFLLFVLDCMGWIYPYNLDELYNWLLALYPATSVVAGYTAASFRTQLAGTGQEVRKCIFLTGVLYLGPLFVIFSSLNTVAISYGATAALPFGTTIAVFFIWAFLIVSLLSVGGIIGYYYSSHFQSPRATRRIPRVVPPLPWYGDMPAKMFLSGLWPFITIFSQLRFLYENMWLDKVYTVYTILFIMVVVLTVVTATRAIGQTYSQLNMGNHKWWWSSLLCGGSIAVFMYAYCFVFYARSNMSGLLQLVFFLGYNAYICYAFFLMLGTVAAYSSLCLVRNIYHASHAHPN